VLISSYCRQKLWNQKSYTRHLVQINTVADTILILHMLIRHTQDSVISTVVLSLITMNIAAGTDSGQRACPKHPLPREHKHPSSQSIKDSVSDATEHLKHPLILPTLFLSSKTQNIEQNSTDWPSSAPYKALSRLTNSIDHFFPSY
jgi:hypothetical protein